MPVINGQPVPIAGYEVGRFYTEAPTNGAYECRGFANLIYKRIWNSYTYGTAIASKDTSTESKAKASIQLLKVGAMIHCFCISTQYNHSMIIIAWNATGVTVYDANWDDFQSIKNKIGTRTWTWKEFSSKFSQITDGYNP